MHRPLRCCLLVGSLVALSTGAAACGSSGGSDAASTGATKATTTTTTTAPTTETTAPGDDGTTTTTTTTSAAGGGTGSIDCQALLRRYADVFDPDDLREVVTFFREYEPSMPDDVAAATERLATAYEGAGDLGHLDLSDVDLSADAETFSDWTNDGCPTR